MHPRIALDPRVCNGQPTVQGTRILVSNILASLAAGEEEDAIRGNDPGLKEGDSRAALEFATELPQFRTMP